MPHGFRDGGLEILLVHASGDYNATSPWAIPKGWPNPGENLDDTARHETREETGVDAPAVLFEVGRVIYRRSRHEVYCFAGAVDAQCEPRCTSLEIDRAEFLSLQETRPLIHPVQAEFILRRGTFSSPTRSLSGRTVYFCTSGNTVPFH